MMEHDFIRRLVWLVARIGLGDERAFTCLCHTVNTDSIAGPARSAYISAFKKLFRAGRPGV